MRQAGSATGQAAEITLATLAGRWRLTRAIEDARAGVTGTLQGVSTWEEDGAGLRQTEDGLLRYGAAPPMRAQRVYLWRAGAEGLEVFFEDGRPFHRVATAGAARDTHFCAPDIYRVTYDFSDWPAAFATRWHVTGPRKDHVIRSRFERA